MITLAMPPEMAARHVTALYRCAALAYSRGQTAYGTETARVAELIAGQLPLPKLPKYVVQDLAEAKRRWACTKTGNW